MTKIIFAITPPLYLRATSKLKTKQVEEVYYHISADNYFFTDF